MTNQSQDKVYSTSPEIRERNRLAQQRYREKQGENYKNKRREYQPTPKYRLKKKYRDVQRALKFPERLKAQEKVQRAIKGGELIKPHYCEDCGKKRKSLHGHHWSYEEKYWLDVEWLCASCHAKRRNDM